MSEVLNDLIKDLSAKLTAELEGDGAGTCGTFPFIQSWQSVVAPEPLTLEKLRQLIVDFSPSSAWPVRLIEVEPYPIYGPARRHRKRRIQKKWLKRYGTAIVGYECPMGDNVLVDKKRGIGYCHPHAARWIRAQTVRQRESAPICPK